jgi:peptidoglycan/xylan/chitin deacetylase (PgdA/CDA1 family)
MQKLPLTLLRSSSILPTRFWIRLWGGTLFLPFYHLVSDEAPKHVRHLYPVRSVQQFKEDLDFLLRFFRPIDLPTLWGHVFEGKPFERPVFHLTFDDGLRECYDVIMPILLEKGIPATFFLNPDFMDNRALMFRYKASLLHDTGQPLTADPLRVPYEDRHLLDEWAIAIGLDYQAYLSRQKPYLDWAQAESMHKQGFSFGAHSLDHPLYAAMPQVEQIRQTAESVAAVRQRLPTEHAAFAFPFTDHGVWQSFFTAAAAQTGGQLLTFGAAGVKRDTVLTHLQRFPMERTRLSAQTLLSSTLAGTVLKRLLGKDLVNRAV